jgi:hypothetical protein
MQTGVALFIGGAAALHIIVLGCSVLLTDLGAYELRWRRQRLGAGPSTRPRRF